MQFHLRNGVERAAKKAAAGVQVFGRIGPWSAALPRLLFRLPVVIVTGKLRGGGCCWPGATGGKWWKKMVENPELAMQSTIQNCTGAIKNAGFGGNGGLGGGYTARRNFMIELGARHVASACGLSAHPAGMVYILTVRHGALVFCRHQPHFPTSTDGCDRGLCLRGLPLWLLLRQFCLEGVYPLWPGHAARAGLYRHRGAAGTSIARNQIHKGCGARIKYKKTCPDHGEVTAGEIVSGYQHSPGEYVIIEGSELDKLRSEKDKAVNIVAFIKPDAIHPSQYSGGMLYLVPDGPVGYKPYALLLRAMTEQGQYAFATVVLGSNDQIVLLRPAGGLLAMTFLNFALGDRAAV